MFQRQLLLIVLWFDSQLKYNHSSSKGTSLDFSRKHQGQTAHIEKKGKRLNSSVTVFWPEQGISLSQMKSPFEISWRIERKSQLFKFWLSCPIVTSPCHVTANLAVTCIVTCIVYVFLLQSIFLFWSKMSGTACVLN